MKQIYLDRLKILAILLSEISDEIWYTEVQPIVFYDQAMNQGFEVSYFRWAFYETPYLFNDWYYKGETSIYDLKKEEWYQVHDIPVLNYANEDYGTAWSAMRFFGLDDLEEFLHLFGSGENLQQPEKFGGRIYPSSDKVNGKHIADNIVSFILKVENDK